MLDQNLKDQLQEVFANLESKIELVYKESDHPDQQNLLTLLSDVSSTSPHISLRPETDAGKEVNSRSDGPQFHIQTNGRPNGIYFRGIPGSHEFTSLVLAILNSDRKGKWPDEAIAERIRRIKGPVRLRTYISLSCENCPDVVQALNLMAVIHGDFEHEMIDGAYAQSEIKDLNIQGVPSIVAGDRLIHSGRIQFIDLLTKLEEHFGQETSEALSTNRELGHFDVVVVGGGPAGVSAAIYSVRKGLKTALIAERIGGQVQETKGIENLISVIYTEGPTLAGQLLQHLNSYPVKIFEHRRVKSISETQPRQLVLESGETMSAESIIITTGAKWRELGVPGEKEYLGRGVAFCPHCDGPYYRGKKVAVVGGGNSGVEAAIDLAGIVDKVILFEFQDQLKADDVLVKKLTSLNNVSVVTSAKTTAILGDGQKVTTLEYQDRLSDEKKQVALDGVFVQIGLLPNSQVVKSLVETTPFGEIVTDPKGRTSAPGIYAAGDVTTTPYKQIIIAMGEGARAALAAFEDRMLQKT